MPVRIDSTVMDVAVPAVGGAPGIAMAGFTGHAERRTDLRMVPYPAVTVFIDFGDVTITDEVSGTSGRGGVVVGLHPGDVVRSGQEVDVLQVRLSPVMAHSVFGGCAELGGAVVGFDELWGPESEALCDRLRQAASWDERFAIAEAAIVRRCAQGRAVDPEVAFAWRRMVRTRGQVRVEGVAREVGWSRKRLWSRFGSQVGLTPKRAARLVRFDHVVHRLAAGHAAALVAAESGFTDQSHLYRDVMDFTGLTSTAAAVAPWLAVDDVAWPTSHAT